MNNNIIQRIKEKNFYKIRIEIKKINFSLWIYNNYNNYLFDNNLFISYKNIYTINDSFLNDLKKNKIKIDNNYYDFNFNIIEK